MAKLDRLQNVVNQLVAKATETQATLAGLAQAVVDLKTQLGTLPPDQQAAIDAIADQGQAALDTLTAAEDAADDQLPAGPVVGPT